MNEKEKNYAIKSAILMSTISVVFGIFGLIMVKGTDAVASIGSILTLIAKFSALPSLILSIIVMAKDEHITSMDIFSLVMSSMAIAISGITFFA